MSFSTSIHTAGCKMSVRVAESHISGTTFAIVASQRGCVKSEGLSDELVLFGGNQYEVTWFMTDEQFDFLVKEINRIQIERSNANVVHDAVGDEHEQVSHVQV